MSPTVYHHGSRAFMSKVTPKTITPINRIEYTKPHQGMLKLDSNKSMKLHYLIELLEKSLGRKAAIDRQPVQPGDVPITFANIDKARKKLGYNPRVKIEEGVPKFVEWFLQRH